MSSSSSFPEDLPEDIPPEIAREMVIPLMNIPKPDEWRGYIKEEDLADFDPKNKRILLAMSKMEQKEDFIIKWLQLANKHLRYFESELIQYRKRLENEDKERLKDKWKWALIAWIGTIAGAGIVAALIEGWIKKLFH
jgi:hypothetical protein